LKGLVEKLINKYPILGERGIRADLIVAFVVFVVTPFAGLLWNLILYILDIPDKEVTQLNFFVLCSKLLNIKLLINIKIWQSLLLLICLYILYRFITYFRSKRLHMNNPIWKEQVGNYTVGELFTILKDENLPLRTVGMDISGVDPPDDNLLVLFETYEIFLNAGVSNESALGDHGYIWGILAPKLMGYGLLTQSVVTNDDKGFLSTTTTYQTSELGHEFSSAMRRLYITFPSNKAKVKSE